MTRRLIALDLAGGPGFVTELRRAWDDGDAVLPVDQRLPPSARAALLDRLRPHRVITAAERIARTDGIEVADGDAVVVATSGSTGQPKGVVLTHDSVAASARATSERLGIDEDDHWLACLPLSHVGGLSVVTRALWRGTGLTVIERFDVDAVNAAARHGANLVSLVATALARIDPALFDTIVLGGSRPPAQRPSNTVTTYGMTETGSGVVYDRVPLTGVEVRIVDDEIHLRAPMLLRCYRGGPGPDFETDPLTDDGWFATGDLGNLDDAGQLHVAGRRSELIITGGENVWPEQVEALLRAAPGIADVMVAGAPDPEWGEVVTAHVVPTPGAPTSLEDLREIVKAQLPSFCAPRQLVLHARLPRTALGKPQRHLLGNEPRTDFGGRPRHTQ